MVWNYKSVTGKKLGSSQICEYSIYTLEQCVKEEIKWDIKKYLETNENGNLIHQNLWDATEADPRGKFTSINTFIKTKEIYQINKLIFPFKRLGKEQTIPSVGRRKEIKSQREMNDTLSIKTVEMLNKTKSSLFWQTKLRNF